MSDKDATYPNSRVRRDQQAYRQNPNDQGVDRRVADLDAHEKLDQVISGLGVGNTTPSIQNILIPNKDIEQTLTLPNATKSYIIRSRLNGKLRLAFSAGETSTNYLTIPAGSSYKDENFYSSQAIYFRSTKDNDVLELVVYT